MWFLKCCYSHNTGAQGIKCLIFVLVRLVCVLTLYWRSGVEGVTRRVGRVLTEGREKLRIYLCVEILVASLKIPCVTIIW